MAGVSDYTRANELVVDEEFEEALAAYDRAVAAEPGNAQYLTKRAACYIKLKRFTNAVADANAAIAADSANGMAHFRKGVACFELDEFESALEAFKKAGSLGAKGTSTWVRKCEAEIADDEMDEEEAPPAAAVEETKAAPAAASPAAASAAAPTATSTAAAAATATAATSADLAPLPGFSRVKHDWYQTGTHVFVTIYAKKVEPQNAKIDISAAELAVELQLPSGREFQLDVSLFDTIDVAASSYRVSPVKVEIKLQKTKPNVKWPGLERAEGAQPVAWADTSAVDKSVYPTSSKKGPKNWDAITKEDEEEKLSGDAALNKVFQDIFAKGSDEQRRAMMKSFTESGGTVLSTNWEDVGKRTVEGTPPKGMEMHNWSELEKGK